MDNVESKHRAFSIYVVPKNDPDEDSRRIINCQVPLSELEGVRRSFTKAEDVLKHYIPEGHFMVKYKDQTKIGV